MSKVKTEELKASFDHERWLQDRFTQAFLLKLESYADELHDRILTIAPEASTEDLRRLLVNTCIDERQIRKVINYARTGNW